MPYTLAIATPDTRALVVAALTAAADQRTRVAKGAARKVAEAKRSGRDVRAQAVKVTALLAEADELTELAAELEAADDVPVVTRDAVLVAGIPVVGDPGQPADEARIVDTATGETVGTIPIHEDDGTSPAAQALAAAAGLDAAIVDDDVDTGSIAEDDTDPEEIL